jgi:branched-chain amino acid transport system permease protein
VGQLYVAPVFTMMVGAYVSAYLARDLNWPFSLSVLTAVGIGAMLTLLLGIGLARAPAFATAISTIALIFIAQAVFRNLEFLGGPRGYFGIPEVEHLLPITYGVAVIVGVIIYRLDHSPFGRAMEVIFTNPDLAASLGIDANNYRLLAQTFSGALGALTGGLYAFYMGYLHPYDIGFSTVLFLVCFIFVGGYTTMWGLIFFTPILWALTVFLPDVIAVWKDVIYGTLLVAVLISRPEGVIDKKLLRFIMTKSRVFLGYSAVSGMKNRL